MKGSLQRTGHKDEEASVGVRFVSPPSCSRREKALTYDNFNSSQLSRRKKCHPFESLPDRDRFGRVGILDVVAAERFVREQN